MYLGKIIPSSIRMICVLNVMFELSEQTWFVECWTYDYGTI